jgi:3',5'-cyclic AMP phosphodiesterase CpdA
MLKMSAGALLAANLWPRRARAADPATKPLKFIQVNDFHYFDDNCAPFFEGLVKEFNKVEGTAFVLVVGDLVDGGTLGQCHALHDILGGLKVPYYVTAGNHDPVSQTDRSPWESVFGNKLNVSMEINGWQFVGLDTSDGVKASGFDCHKETLDFAATLPSKLDKDKPTFIYTHFPLGPGVNNRLRNADALLEPFKQLNVSAIFSGHYHAYTQKAVLNNAIATTDVCSSFKRANHDGTFQKGFFILEAADGKWKRTFVDYGTNFPGGAAPTGKKPDPAPARPADLSKPWY